MHTQGLLCKRRGRPWHLHGDCTAFLELSLRPQRSGNTVKARGMPCERRGRAVRAQRISTMNTAGTLKNAMRASWERLVRCKEALTDNFSRKI